MGVPWADSVARCVVQCTEFHCESGGLGLGLWGFFPIIYCSAVLRLLARQALLSFPRAVDEALLWVHAHPAGRVWWLLGTGGLWCRLLPVCNQKWLTETQRNGNWNTLDFQTVVPAVLSHVTLRCVHRAAPCSLVLLQLSSFPGCNQLSK